MTTPNGTRGAQARADAGLTDLALAPTSSGKSQYGLGVVSGSPVIVGGLLPVLGKDGKPVAPDKDGAFTAEQVVAAFSHASPGQIAAIQHQLVLGGFYGASYTPNYGVINGQDLDAFAKATTTAAQTGGDLSEYLARQAKYGEYQGVAAAMSAQGAGKARTIQKADPLALSAMIEKEFQNLTGRKPTDAERAGFIAAYNTAFTQIQNSNYDSAEAAQGTAATVDAADFNTAPVQAFDPNVIGPDRADALNSQVEQSHFMAEPQITPGQAAGTATSQDFDPAAFAEQYVRDHATGETDAHAVTDQFGTFLSLLKGIG